jgi:hypothetical protein
LGQDLKQLIVTEEVEAREGSAFRLQVILQTLLDVLKHLVVCLEFLQQFLRTTTILDQRSLMRLHHLVFPELINLEEFGSLLRQLLLDVISIENVL